jgi:hypothetical protein
MTIGSATLPIAARIISAAYARPFYPRSFTGPTLRQSRRSAPDRPAMPIRPSCEPPSAGGVAVFVKVMMLSCVMLPTTVEPSGVSGWWR